MSVNRVSIRPDMCIALRLIGMAELQRVHMKLAEYLFDDLVKYGKCVWEVTPDGEMRGVDPHTIYNLGGSDD